MVVLPEIKPDEEVTMAYQVTRVERMNITFIHGPGEVHRAIQIRVRNGTVGELKHLSRRTWVRTTTFYNLSLSFLSLSLFVQLREPTCQ